MSKEEVVAQVVVDTSQSLDRQPWCYSKVRSLTTSSRYYWFAADALLQPKHAFALLGFTSVNLEPFANRPHVAAELAAEAMSVASVGQVLAVVSIALSDMSDAV